MSLGLVVDFQMNVSSVVDKLKRDFLMECADELNSVFIAAIQILNGQIGVFINEQIKNTYEYNAIISGQLHGELGLKEPVSIMQAIIDQIVISTKIENKTIKIAGNNLVGGFSLNILPSNYSDILNLPSAKYISNQFEIPWLKWLLLEGDNILVVEYKLLTPINSVQQNFSRSKKALMIKKRGGVWKVPSQYQGTAENNFILNSLTNAEAEQKILTMFQQAVYSQLTGV